MKNVSYYSIIEPFNVFKQQILSNGVTDFHLNNEKSKTRCTVLKIRQLSQLMVHNKVKYYSVHCYQHTDTAVSAVTESRELY